MTDTTPASLSAEATPKSLISRIFGVFFSPRATYANVATFPRWFGVVAVTCLILAGGYFVFLSTDTGKQATLDQQTQVLESFGLKLNDAAYDRMEAGVERARFTTPISQIIGVPIVIAVFSGIILGIFNALLGGDARFKQVYAILAHTTLFGALQTVFALPLDYVRQTLSSPTTLLALMPFVDDGSFIGRLLGTIDLFQIWSLFSLAIGLGVLYKRRTAPVAVSLYTVYALILIAVAAIRTALSS